MYILKVESKVMCKAEIPHPFMRHPLVDPRFINCERVISVTQGSDSQGGPIRELITCLTVKEWIDFEAFVQGVRNKDIDERREGVTLAHRGLD